ncbi:MAG: hypothetical protein QM765_49600 [Myxococcales bacterium]
MMPRAYRSARPSISSPTHCSGDMYSGVPTTRPAAVTPGLPEFCAPSLAMPKSTSLTNWVLPPRRTRKMFSGLRSRWTTLAAWAACSASQACERMGTATSGAMGVPARVESGTPSRYSITRYQRLGGIIDRSKMLTMFSCPMRLTLVASAKKRSMSVFSPTRCGWRNLMATLLPMMACSPR